MIKYYIKTSRDRNLREIKDMRKGCWIYISKPSGDECEELAKKIGIDVDFLTDSMDENERPRIDNENGTLLVIFRIPYREPSGESILTLPLGIIITRDYFITVCKKDNRILNEFINKNIKGFYTSKKTRFLLQIFARVNAYYMKYLHEIEGMIKNIENKLMHSFRNEEIISLLELQKILVYFNTSIIANGNVMERILGGKIINLYEEDQDLLEDIIVENRQAIEMINIYTNILSNSMDAYASIISNNLNVVMKFLASVTIIISMPTMVASFYGMNVELPFQHSAHAFLITLVISFIISSLLAIIFWKKEWL